MDSFVSLVFCTLKMSPDHQFVILLYRMDTLETFSQTLETSGISGDELSSCCIFWYLLKTLALHRTNLIVVKLVQSSVGLNVCITKCNMASYLP